MLKDIKIYSNNKKTIEHPKYKKITIPKTRSSRYNNNKIKKLSINTYINNTSILDNSRQDLINTIKNFITDTTEESYTNKSKPNISPSPKSMKIKNNQHNLNNSKISKINNKRKNIQNKLLLNRDLSNYTNYSKINKSHIRNILTGMSRNKARNSNNINNVNNINSNNINNYTNINTNTNTHTYTNDDSVDFEYEIEKRIKEIESLKTNIKNLSNKIELMKYEINIINNYFNQVNKQLLKVLFNSKTIKVMQKNFDKEIPNIKEEINDIKNKIYHIKKETEMYDIYNYNITQDIIMKKEEENEIKYINKNLYSEISYIKNKIVLIQSLNKKYKTLLTTNIFY